MDVVFTEIFKRNFWGDRESVSGSGSNQEQTRVIVREIPRVLKEVGARTLLDLPCGDFNWMQRVDLSGVSYTGGEIVQDLVDLLGREVLDPEQVSVRVVKGHRLFSSQGRQYWMAVRSWVRSRSKVMGTLPPKIGHSRLTVRPSRPVAETRTVWRP